MINGYQAGRCSSSKSSSSRSSTWREKSYPTSHFLWGTESHEVQGSMKAIGAKKEAFSDTQMLLLHSREVCNNFEQKKFVKTQRFCAIWLLTTWIWREKLRKLFKSANLICEEILHYNMRKWKMRLFELIFTQRVSCKRKNVIETGSLCRISISFFFLAPKAVSTFLCNICMHRLCFSLGFPFLPSFVTHVRYNKKQVSGLQRYVRAFLPPLTNGLFSFSIPYILF